MASGWPASAQATGAVVLLSPAAPSYDNYRDFTERGMRFRELLGEALERERRRRPRGATAPCTACFSSTL